MARKPDLPPGPELDVVVARFMGYKIEPLSEWPEYWPGVQDRNTMIRVVWAVPDLEDGAFVEGRPGDPGGDWRPWRIPKYSTEIAEAWKVFEKIRETHEALVDKNALLFGAADAVLLENIKGETAGHAIALAAKKLFDERGKR